MSDADLSLVPTSDLLGEVNRRCGGILTILFDPPDRKPIQVWVPNHDDMIPSLLAGMEVIDHTLDMLLPSGPN